ncbi:MAG TPA: TlpA disulfide reductase family protein [Nitrospirota bacterium]|nr:TlpA disulfide reductase family protein [Nitrospirota bacterium]
MKNTARILGVCLALLLAAQPAFAALKRGDAAPDVVLQDRTGKKYTLSDILPSGSRGIVLSFFASWCAPCRLELPLMNGLQDELKQKGIRLVLVNVKEDFGAIDSMIRELKLDSRLVLSDRYGKTAEAYQVRFLPTTFFIGEGGAINDIIFGEVRDKDTFMKSLNKIKR